MYSLLNFTISLYLSLSLQPTHLANFNQVQSIQYSPLEEKDRKGMLQLNVAGAPEVKHTHTHTHVRTHTQSQTPASVTDSNSDNYS